MDINTIIVLLAIGSFVFGLLLLVFEFRNESSRHIPFWISAKFLQGAGSLLLYYSDPLSVSPTLLIANCLLLVGCAYEGWAVVHIAGSPVCRTLHLSTSAAVVTLCLANALLAPPHRLALVFLVHTVFYVLPGVVLLRRTDSRSLLCRLLGSSYLVVATIFCSRSLWLWFAPQQVGPSFSDVLASQILLCSAFCMMLVSGFSMLLLARENSDAELHEMQESLRKSEEHYRRMIDTAIEGVLSLDNNFRIMYANRQMAVMLGYDMEEMVGQKLDAFLADDQLAASAVQAEARTRGRDAVYEACFRRRNGEKHWLLVSAKAVVDSDGTFAGSFAMFTDINDRKNAEDALEASHRKLEALSNTDSLTGIANRRHFDEVLATEYIRHSRSGAKLSLILLDVDHFKAFNDTYGHVRGDQCLQQIGQVLAGCAGRATDMAARYGGEEFACILPETNLSGAIVIAELIRRSIQGLRIPNEGVGPGCCVTASLGVVTVACTTDRPVSDILLKADKLLYQAKSSGRNRVEYTATYNIGSHPATFAADVFRDGAVPPS